MNINFSIILHIQSDNKSLLNFYTFTGLKLLKNYQIFVYNSIIFPTKISKFTVLRSPHIYKKSREQFEYCLFSSSFSIDIFDLYSFYKVCFLLFFFKYQLPSGILLKVKNIFSIK